MKLIVAIVAIFQVLGLLSAVHAVMSTRPPQGAIAWAVSLVTFPYVAVPAYWISGRDKFRGYVLARQETVESIQPMARNARDGVEDSTADEGAFIPDVSIAEKLARIPLTGGNEVELLIDGRNTFASIFAGIDAVVQAIQLAGLRGVDVRILIPEKSDSALITLAAYAFFDQVAATGARFYRYQDGFLHQKVALVDDRAVTIGTANFDNRSFRLNFEVTAVVSDPAIATDVEKMFEMDFERSRLMAAGEYDRKPLWFRFAVRVARLFAPVL